MQLNPGAYKDQIQIAAHPPAHKNPAPKHRVWGFFGVNIYILLPKMHMNSLVLILILTTMTGCCVDLSSARNKIIFKKKSVH